MKVHDKNRQQRVNRLLRRIERFDRNQYSSTGNEFRLLEEESSLLTCLDNCAEKIPEQDDPREQKNESIERHTTIQKLQNMLADAYKSQDPKEVRETISQLTEKTTILYDLDKIKATLNFRKGKIKLSERDDYITRVQKKINEAYSSPENQRLAEIKENMNNLVKMDSNYHLYNQEFKPWQFLLYPEKYNLIKSILDKIKTLYETPLNESNSATTQFEKRHKYDLFCQLKSTANTLATTAKATPAITGIIGAALIKFSAIPAFAGPLAWGISIGLILIGVALLAHERHTRNYQFNCFKQDEPTVLTPGLLQKQG